MPLQPWEHVALTGTYLYDGVVECDVRIIHSTITPGSGDHEDPPERRDDRNEECYYVQYGSITQRGNFNAGGGGGATLEAAIKVAESVPGIGPTMRWHAR